LKVLRIIADLDGGIDVIKTNRIPYRRSRSFRIDFFWQNITEKNLKKGYSELKRSKKVYEKILKGIR